MVGTGEARNTGGDFQGQARCQVVNWRLTHRPHLAMQHLTLQCRVSGELQALEPGKHVDRGSALDSQCSLSPTKPTAKAQRGRVLTFRMILLTMCSSSRSLLIHSRVVRCTSTSRCTTSDHVSATTCARGLQARHRSSVEAFQRIARRRCQSAIGLPRLTSSLRLEYDMLQPSQGRYWLTVRLPAPALGARCSARFATASMRTFPQRWEGAPARSNLL